MWRVWIIHFRYLYSMICMQLPPQNPWLEDKYMNVWHLDEGPEATTNGATEAGGTTEYYDYETYDTTDTTNTATSTTDYPDPTRPTGGGGGGGSNIKTDNCVFWTLTKTWWLISAIFFVLFCSFLSFLAFSAFAASRACASWRSRLVLVVTE